MATSTIKTPANMLTPSYSFVSHEDSVTGVINLMRFGKLRTLFGYINPNTSGTSIVLGTLDPGDCPPVVIVGTFSGYGVTQTGEITIQTNGVIRIAINGTPTNDVKFNITYGVG